MQLSIAAMHKENVLINYGIQISNCLKEFDYIV
jgi:hypothetical protein